MNMQNSWPNSAGDAEASCSGSCRGIRLQAVVSDANGGAPLDLGQVWAELVSGARRAADHFSTEERCYLISIQTTAPTRPPLGDAPRALLERVLLGEQQKRIALDLGVSASTVAYCISDGLKALGLTCRASRLPLILSLLAHAARGISRSRHGRLSRVLHEGQCYDVISTERPDLSLWTRLSPAEVMVLRLLVDGKSHAEIARRRNVSARTIANQLASASRKLGISGRPGFLTLLARAGANGSMAAHAIPREQAALRAS